MPKETIEELKEKQGIVIDWQNSKKNAKRFVVFAFECNIDKQNALVQAAHQWFDRFPQAQLVSICSGKSHRAIYFTCEQAISQGKMPKTAFLQMFSADLMNFMGLVRLKEPKKEME